MNYPNKKVEYKKVPTSTSKRGMSLEEDINKSNEYYLNCHMAVVHKKPTPITIVKVDYPKRSAAKIVEAYFKQPSTTDYNGIYKGYYLDFEAKECNLKTYFPFHSIHAHQVKHLQEVVNQGAIAFLIIRMSQYGIDYLIEAKKFLHFYNTTNRESLPYSWIQENGYEIQVKYTIPCDYLKIVDELIKEA